MRKKLIEIYCRYLQGRREELHNNLACSVGRDVNREPEHTLPGAASTDVAALRRYCVPQHLSSPLATALRHDTN
jgi:hypothetical protein